jgi:putative ABC transport system substrate-binding protein
VTGVGSFPPVADTIELMKRLLPGVTRIGTLYNSSEANSRKVVEVARSACAERGLRLEEVTIANVSEVFQAAQALTARDVGAVWLGGDNTVIQGFEAVAKVVGDAHIPLVTNDMEQVATHSLATVGIGFYESGFAAAKLASQVLLGEKPKDVAIQNVAKREVSINAVVARKLGLRLPEEVLHEADVVVDDAGTHRKQ